MSEHHPLQLAKLGESLDAIGLRYGTDKASHHHDFLGHYERRVAHLRHQAFSLFEVGVYKGASIKTWGDYFRAAQIVGIDVDASCEQYAGGNVDVVIGDASSTSLAFDLVQKYGHPSVFIDDGSHRWDHQINTFQMYWPLLEPGGVYILEDLDTSFDGHLKTAPFQGFSHISAFDYLVKLSRMLVGDAAVQDEQPYDLFIASTYKTIASLEFIRRSAIITKR